MENDPKVVEDELQRELDQMFNEDNYYQDDLLERSNQEAWEDAMADMNDY
jgi:hypothetical protein